MTEPAVNVATCIDVLGCERVDHGVRVVDDPELLARVVDRQIALTVCPISNVVIAGLAPDVASHPFRALHEAGALATINSDDPGMTGTTIVDDFEQVAVAYGYDAATMAGIARRAIGAGWAPDDEQCALAARFDHELATLGVPA